MPSFCRNGFVTNSLQVGLSTGIAAIRDMLKFSPFGLGCQTCSSKQETLIRTKNQTMLCLPSYFAQWNQFPTSTSMISNCKQYSFPLVGTLSADFSSFQSTPKCAKCLPGFLETVNGLTCHASSASLAHCLLVDSSNGHCTQCADHYYVLSGQCQPNTIEFCQVSQYDSGSSSTKCISCDPGYYFNSAESTSSCLPGQLSNCKEYSSGDGQDCSVCEEGYQPVPVNGSKKQCIRLAGTHCETILTTSSQMSQNKFECSECESGFFLSERIELTNKRCLLSQPFGLQTVILLVPFTSFRVPVGQRWPVKFFRLFLRCLRNLDSVFDWNSPQMHLPLSHSPLRRIRPFTRQVCQMLE